MAVHGYPVDFKHAGQDSRERAFCVIRRSHESAAGGLQARTARRGEAFAVSLAAGHHRDGRQLLQVSGHHVRGQPLAQRLENVARVHRGRVLLRAVVGDQLNDIGVGPVGVDHRLRDAGDAQQDRFDLGQLDAVAADLHLRVDAAVMLDLALRVHPPEVAGAVDLSWRIAADAEEVRPERALGEVGPVDVAVGKPDARDADLAHDSRRERHVFLRIEDHDRIGRQRDPDRYRPVRVHYGPGRGHGGLGRTVDVEEAAAGPVPAGDEVPWARFTGNQQEAQFRQVIFQRGQQRGHAAQRRHVALPEERAEVQAKQLAAVRLGDERGAAHPRDPDLLDGEVERDGHPLVHPVVAGDPVGFGGHPDEVADARVADGHALGPASRAGGVDDVGKLVGRRRHLVRGERVVAFRADQVLGLVHARQLDLAGQRAERRRDVRAGQDQPDPGVGGDVGHPVRGEAGVKRNEGGVRLERRQHADVSVHGNVG